MLHKISTASFVGAIGAALAFIAPAAAQEAAGAADQPGADDALKATHGDWEVRCAGEGEDVCYISQVLENDEGAPLIRAVVRPVPENSQAVGLMALQAPLGVVLTRGLQMQVDAGETTTAPYTYCVQNGCYAQIGLAPEGLARLERGAGARITVYSVQQPDEPVQADLSLIGFTKAFDEIR